MKVLNNLKAISLGVTTILILGLINQLVLIMAAVGYGTLIEQSPAFRSWSQVFTYTLAGLGFFVVMAGGGLVTAIASKKNFYTNTIIAAITGSAISLYLSLRDEILTLLALYFLVMGIVFATFGCWIWMKHLLKNTS